MVFNEALAKVVEEKDKVIEQLRERERELLHEKDRDHGRCCHLVREYAGMPNVRKKNYGFLSLISVYGQRVSFWTNLQIFRLASIILADALTFTREFT